MNELIYNIKMLIGFVLVISFVLFWYAKLNYESNFHTNDFVGLNKDFQISIDQNLKEPNTIYISNNGFSSSENLCLNEIPNECINNNKYSIKCLALLKNKGNGHYNGYYFRSADNNCRK